MGRKREPEVEAMGRKRVLEPGVEAERAEPEGRVDVGRKRALEPAEPDEPEAGLGDLLIDRVLDQLDLASIASNLAPDLAGRLVGSIQLDVLGDRVFEKLVDRLANDPIIAEVIAAQLSRLMGGSTSGELPRS